MPSQARELEPTLTSVVAAGGVAANSEVRRQLSHVASDAGLPLVCPPPRLCTDNGVMVAWTGQLRLRLGLHDAPMNLADGVDLHVEVRLWW